MNIKKGTKLIAIDECIMSDNKEKALNLGEEYEVLIVTFCPVDNVQIFRIKSNVGMHTFPVDEANQFFKLKNQKS